jgi:hypothetical protein
MRQVYLIKSPSTNRTAVILMPDGMRLTPSSRALYLGSGVFPRRNKSINDYTSRRMHGESKLIGRERTGSLDFNAPCPDEFGLQRLGVFVSTLGALQFR